MAYYPDPIVVLNSLEEVVDYLARELARIGVEFQLLEDGVGLPIRGVVPAKPREGMLAIADGTGWNPGGGKGLYEYKSGAWAKL